MLTQMLAQKLHFAALSTNLRDTSGDDFIPISVPNHANSISALAGEVKPDKMSAKL